METQMKAMEDCYRHARNYLLASKSYSVFNYNEVSLYAADRSLRLFNECIETKVLKRKKSN